MVTLDDIKESTSPKEITIEWEIDDEEEEMEFKLMPLKYGESIVMAKRSEGEGSDKFEMQYDMLEKVVRTKDEDTGEWKQIKREDLRELPQGFVVKLTMRVNDFLGLGEEVENFPSA